MGAEHDDGAGQDRHRQPGAAENGPPFHDPITRRNGPGEPPSGGWPGQPPAGTAGPSRAREAQPERPAHGRHGGRRPAPEDDYWLAPPSAGRTGTGPTRAGRGGAGRGGAASGGAGGGDVEQPGAGQHGQPRRSGRSGRRPVGWLLAGAVLVVVAALAGAWLARPSGRTLAAGAGGRPAGAAHGRNVPRPAGAGRHGGGQGLGTGRTASAAPAAPAAGAVVSITDVGDMNFGTRGQYPPGGPAAVFAPVRRDLRSSLTVGNLETALGSSGVTKCAPKAKNCYAFQAPSGYARAIRRAGFSAVNVANNHTDDAGPAGIGETDAALRAARLRYAGRPGQTTYLTRDGVKIALLGFAPYAYDRNLLDIPAAVTAVRQAATRARLVIVFIHAGAEGAGAQHVRPGMETYLGEERGDPIAFSHAVVRAGADLVLGSGPHVLRAMQWYRGRLIAYSLGNFAGYYTLGLGGVTADSAILKVTLRADGSFAGGRVIPIRLVGAGTPEPDPARTGIDLIRTLSREDLGASGVRLTRTGRIEPSR
jgi:poly-gamma-glutamate capsule biosynthesis protein CapA/YwtB (metallophosphatase superfamily)